MLHDERGKVTSFIFNTVVMVVPDGRQGKQLIGSNDGLNGPVGIYFCKSKNSLMDNESTVYIIHKYHFTIRTNDASSYINVTYSF
jgi:hypothetical protein